jgi:hypothetical protein
MFGGSDYKNNFTNEVLKMEID